MDYQKWALSMETAKLVTQALSIEWLSDSTRKSLEKTLLEALEEQSKLDLGEAKNTPPQIMTPPKK